MKNIVLIHGFRGGPEGLKDFGDKLEKNLNRQANFFYLSLPPLKEAGNLKNYDESEFIQVILDFLKKNKLEQATLICHSFGTIVGAGFSHHYPEKVEKLILIEPILNKVKLGAKVFLPVWLRLPRKLVDFLTVVGFYHKGEISFGEQLKLTSKSSSRTDKKELRKNIKFLKEKSVKSYNLPKNTFLIASKKDILVKWKEVKELARKEGLGFEIIDEAGHVVNYEQPTKLAKIIARQVR